MKFRTKFFLASLLALTLQQAMGQLASNELEGSWMGLLNAGALELRLVFNISVTENAAFEATLDSPDQGAMAIPLGEVSLTGDSVRIEAPVIAGFYIGEITSDSTIKGEWHQGGRGFELSLDKQTEAFVLNRPQEPLPPFPYREEMVSFYNAGAGFSLGGTLTLPSGEGPFPAVILVTGSGSQNRDEEIFGHKPFKLIADYLTRNGIAVLRYDDRGVGLSGGNPAGSTTADYEEDVRSAIDYLLKRSEIDHLKVGVIGHSEGAMIAFMLASSHKDLAFMVALAGPGIDGKRILLEQSEYINQLSGVDESFLKDNHIVMSQVFDFMITTESYEVWEAKVLEFVDTFYYEHGTGVYSDEDIEQVRKNLLTSIPASSYAWMRYFVMFDPATLFGSIRCPVLALNGEKDCQVLAETNIPAIQNGLVSAGNNHTTTMILPGLNHLFQNCETGLPNEYGIIEETFDQKSLDIISEWIWKQLD